MTYITKYTIEQYNKSIELKNIGMGSQRIAKLLSLKRRGAIEDWINKGRKPYHFSEKRIAACNSVENIERMRNMNRITQPKAVKISAKLRTKRLPNSARRLSQNLGYILGVVYGDGHVSKKQRKIILGAVDRDFVLNFKEVIENWSGFNARLHNRIQKPDNYVKNRKPQWVTYIDSVEASEFLSNFNKNDLLDAEEKIKSAFLKGFFDSEGRINNDGGLLVYNTNLDLIKFVQRLLQSLDIETIFHRYIGKQLGTGKEIETFNLRIRNSQRLKFYEKIGFTIKRKQDRLIKSVAKYLTVK